MSSLSKHNESSERVYPRVLAVTGGKGGVGKTSLAINLAIALARNGSKVCLFDADTGLANVNIMLGLHPAYTLEHLFTGEKSIQDIVVEGPEGVHIVPGASGFAQCVELDVGQQQRLISGIQSIEPHYDYMLVDTAAGIAPTVLHFIAASQVAVVVVTPEPTSLTDAFSLIKVLKRRGYRRKVQVVVNMSPNSSQAEKVFRRFSQAVSKYLDLKTEYLGSVWMDESMRTAVTLQRPVALFPRNDPSARSFYRLAERIDDVFSRKGAPKLAFSAYWQKLVSAYAERAKQAEQQESTSVSVESVQKEEAQVRPIPGKPHLKAVPDIKRHEPGESVSRPQLAKVVELPAQQMPEQKDAPTDEALPKSEPAANSQSVQKSPRPEQVSRQPEQVSPQPEQESKQVVEPEKTSSAIEAQAERRNALLDAESEHRWIQLRVQMSQFITDPNTTPEQVVTLLSSCIFGYADRLGEAAHDLLHGLMTTLEPNSLTAEQKLLMRSELERLGVLSAAEGDEVIQVDSENGERYDAKGFGCQDHLASTIRKSSEGVPLENLLESIKYASLVDTPND